MGRTLHFGVRLPRYKGLVKLPNNVCGLQQLPSSNEAAIRNMNPDMCSRRARPPHAPGFQDCGTADPMMNDFFFGCGGRSFRRSSSHTISTGWGSRSTPHGHRLAFTNGFHCMIVVKAVREEPTPHCTFAANIRLHSIWPNGL